jgi:hypothetical protein
MANEVSPELLSNLETYLKQRERGEISLLSFYYKEVFNKELKINCGGCIEDAIRFLKTYLINKTTKQMNNFKWTGGEKNCVIRIAGGQLTIIDKNTCTDYYAEAIEFNPAYSHLVQRINESAPLTVEKKSIAVKESLKGLEVTILTSNEAKKEELPVKAKRGRPSLK